MRKRDSSLNLKIVLYALAARKFQASPFGWSTICKVREGWKRVLDKAGFSSEPHLDARFPAVKVRLLGAILRVAGNPGRKPSGAFRTPIPERTRVALRLQVGEGASARGSCVADAGGRQGEVRRQVASRGLGRDRKETGWRRIPGNFRRHPLGTDQQAHTRAVPGHVPYGRRRQDGDPRDVGLAAPALLRSVRRPESAPAGPHSGGRARALLD